MATPLQTTSHILMIRPVHFGYNTQTAVNNAFQSVEDLDAQGMALHEFDLFVALLRRHSIDVTVVDDTPAPHTPDSIFPNNWISFHDDGRVVLYPMYAVNRRLERKPHVLKALRSHFRLTTPIDLSEYEQQDRFLEGTGSMVLDRTHKIAYACLSQRTDAGVLEDFCRRLGYTPHTFTATDANGYPIYHTNVMMCIADTYAVICLDSIADNAERQQTIKCLERTDKEIITITLDQMNHFAGNMLQVSNATGERFLVMSSRAYRSLTPGQISQIEQRNPIIHSPLDTIERNGGGSARCMIAEVFLPVE
ncbi:amidinotransferase [Fulvivirgaceae bacterium PWU5]|uniref:Amidinotransferase n=1 Tax=Dawidia cretensis TaxID=2782350 RepID=A0AAP2E4Z4_9BACT|nr:arginine deiminase-related protein [Dawidia cretensis]MBT1711904.1 amidinotransferase [Dawidia cretensis]